MSDVSLSKAVRSNLLHLQNTAKMMDTTQERLATGLKVNSALDNPTNFFTAASLNARAADINTLLDSMALGIQTIEAADNGLSAIVENIESLQSTLRQARQDKSFKVASYDVAIPGPVDGSEVLSFDGGQFDTAASLDLTSSQAVLTGDAPMAATLDFSGTEELSFNVAVNGGEETTITVNAAAITAAGGTANATTSRADVLAAIQAQLAQSDLDVTAELDGSNQLVLTAGESLAAGSSTAEIAVTTNGTPDYDIGDLGMTASTGTLTGTQARTVDQLVNAINNDDNLSFGLRATNDNGQLRLENLSTSEMEVTGLTNGQISGGIGTSDIAGNDVRANLSRQYNETRAELDRLAEDASFNGVNLLRGDNLKIVFNESGTSSIEIQAKNARGEPRAINAANLNLLQVDPADLDQDASIDDLLDNLQSALDEVRSQASDLGSTLSAVQNRENFTKEMINTLETGASNLTLADTNEESANMLALQTRQQLSQTALSLASQADQAVLRLFG